MIRMQTKMRKEERSPIETLSDGTVLFRVPLLIPHMTEPDRVEILKWYIQKGDIVSHDTLLVHCEFLGDDWYVTMPEYSPLQVLKIEAEEGQIVHLHDPLILWRPAPSLTI